MASLAFFERNPPLAVAAAAKLAHLDIAFKPDAKGNKDAPAILSISSGDSFVGSSLILRYVARSAAETKLYGSDALSTTQVSEH